MKTKPVSTSRRSLACRLLLSGSLAVAAAPFAASAGSIEEPIFHYDFSTFDLGPFPYEETEWTEIFGNPENTYIAEYEGYRGFALDYPDGDHYTSAERQFDAVDEVVLRFSIRFPLSVDRTDYNVQFVPWIGLYDSRWTATGAFALYFQDWGRIRVVTGQNGELDVQSVSASDYEEVWSFHGQNYFDEPTDFTLTYNRSTGLATLSASSTTEHGSWVDYSIDFQMDAGVDLSHLRVAGSPGPNRSAPLDHFQLLNIGVSEVLSLEPTVPAEVSIFNAVELHVPTEEGLYYLIQDSADLETWGDVELFEGDGDPVSRFFSTREEDRRFFRVLRTDE